MDGRTDRQTIITLAGTYVSSSYAFAVLSSESKSEVLDNRTRDTAQWYQPSTTITATKTVILTVTMTVTLT